MYSVDLRITYDAALITALGVTKASSIETWTLVANLETPGVINVALATGNQPISTSGELISIQFQALDQTGVSDLTIENGALNEGGIASGLIDGSLTIMHSASLIGSFTLESRSQYDVGVSVKLYEMGAGTPSYEFAPTASTEGEFTVGGIIPGDYEIAVKHDNTLQIVDSVTVSSGANTHDFGELLTGDANNDNRVSLGDFLLLVESYNLQVGDALYDARADFNGDGRVTLNDFLLLVGNFNTAGEEPSDPP